MTDCIVLRLDAELKPMSWVMLSAAGPGPVQATSVAPNSKLPVVAITPSPAIAVKAIQVPQKAQDKFRQALGFALEDQLANDIDDLQCALPVPLLPGQQFAGVLAKTQLQTAREHAAVLGFTLQALLPEASLLPPDTILIERKFASFHFSDATARSAVDRHEPSCGSTDSESLQALLRLRHAHQGALPLQLLHIPELPIGNLPSHIQASVVPEVLSYYAQRLQVTSPLLSLIARGEAASLAGQPDVSNAAWRWTRWALLAAAIVSLLSFLLAHWRLRVEASQQDQEITQIYQTLFPGAELALDPLGRIQSKLKSGLIGQQTIGPLTLLRQIGPVLSTELQLTLLNLNYRNGILDLTFRSPDLASLERMRTRLAALNQIDATMGSNRVDPDGRMLTAHLLVEAKP